MKKYLPEILFILLGLLFIFVVVGPQYFMKTVGAVVLDITGLLMIFWAVPRIVSRGRFSLGMLIMGIWGFFHRKRN